MGEDPQGIPSPPPPSQRQSMRHCTTFLLRVTAALTQGVAGGALETTGTAVARWLQSQFAATHHAARQGVGVCTSQIRCESSLCID